MAWRKDLNKGIKPYLEKLIRKSFLFKNEYNEAADKGKAQLWVALALLSKQLDELELKLKLFEGVLKEISPKKASKLKESKETEKARAEVEQIVKNIAAGKPVMPSVPKPSIPKPPKKVEVKSRTKKRKKIKKKGLKKKRRKK